MIILINQPQDFTSLRSRGKTSRNKGGKNGAEIHGLEVTTGSKNCGSWVSRGSKLKRQEVVVLEQDAWNGVCGRVSWLAITGSRSHLTSVQQPPVLTSANKDYSPNVTFKTLHSQPASRYLPLYPPHYLPILSS